MKIGNIQLVQIPVNAVGMESSDGRSNPAEISEEKYGALKKLVTESSASMLPKGEQEAFLSLLLEFIDCFYFPGDQLGRTSKIRHCINTGNHPPIRQNTRRLPPSQRQDFKSSLNDMLLQGVVQPSVSPWASPIVLVKKKDSTVRFCVEVNNITRKDAYPLSRIDETLDTLAGSNTLNLAAG